MVRELVGLSETGWDFYWVAIFIMPLFFFVFWLKTLNALGPFVIVSNILTLVSVIFIFVSIFENIDFSEHDPYKTKDYLQIPAFFGIYLFSIETSGVVSTKILYKLTLYFVPYNQILSLEEEMKNPRMLTKPVGILNIMFPFVILLYLLIGVLGYFKYGEDVDATILQNFPDSKY